ncbi:hypothetical protein ABH973_006714 [Bradyrhizobium ottawaense]|uniref:hypothetical protein n=1 Tax=Bradyrhizobium ottawaense TaxID=931866 RepID=UPI003511A03A
MADISTLTPAIARASGLNVRVEAFHVQGFSFVGGAVAIAAAGTWYVGVDLFTQALIALPRLGHRGWIPVAKVVASASAVTLIQQISPVLPVTRIPRVLKKIIAGQAINVVVMGSSLEQGGNTTDWPGMLFNASSGLTAYRVPGTISTKYKAVGGAPNQYQLAQLGFASGHTGYGYPSAGFPRALEAKLPPNGRSQLFSGVDLVVIGVLANGGDYRLECIEPIIRKLRQAGVEVILTTDNPQAASSWTLSYAALSGSGLYVDGPEVIRIADLYGVELADTAAYVFDATLRYTGDGRIYAAGDSIHMANGAPAGRTAAPSCGHEVWARAVRSVITIDGQPGAPVSTSYDFSSGLQGWTNYAGANSSVSAASGALAITKAGAGTVQWGGWITSLSQIYVGDTVRVRGTVTGAAAAGFQIGLQSGGWAGGPVSVNSDGAFDVTLTCTVNSTSLLMYGGNNAAAQGTVLTVDDIQVDITHNTGTAVDLTSSRPSEARVLPPIRVVTDYKTPADAFVILPTDELYTVQNNANKGALGAHPWGASSFARSWNSGIGSTSDLLTLATGKSAILSGHCVVGLSLIRYQDQTDVACTFDVYRNDTFVKTINIGTVPFGNEWYTTIWTPTEYGQSAPTDVGESIRLQVTSGTLKIAALLALTADIDYLFPEEIKYVGNWLAREQEGGAQMWGYPTDTVGAFAVVKCTGRRVLWFLANRSNSQPVDMYSDRESTLAQSQAGVNHIRTRGGLLGPGLNHTIKLTAAAASPVAGNRSLHVGGAIIVNDR